MPVDEPSDGVLVVTVEQDVGDGHVLAGEGTDAGFYGEVVELVEVNILAGPDVEDVLFEVVIIAFVPLELAFGSGDVLLFFLNREVHA